MVFWYDKTMTLEEISKLIMEQAKDKGFGIKPEDINVAEKIALIHSEISEAYEAYRNKKGDNFKEELGDAVQRILHLCGVMNIDIEEAIIKKLESNKDRKWNWDKMNERHT